MKYIKILPIIAIALMIFSSCDDQLMEWGKDPSHGEVTGAELPLELQEKISRYDVLKNYTDFKLGVGVALSLYMSDDTYRKLANENFDEVTVGYEMKHGPMVNAKGEVIFDKVDAFIAKVKAAGLSVYGHTLVWHSNQNASYLNGLIAPTIIPGSSGTNVLDLTNLKNGSFTGWSRNQGAGMTVVNNAGLAATDQAVKMISSATSANAWDLQLTTPAIPIVSGHNYQLSFYVKSETAGKGRVSFSGLVNNYPWKDWYGTGAAATEAFVTTSQWQQVKVKLSASDFAVGGTSFKFSMDMGYLPNVTYYVDVNTLTVVDLDAVPVVPNLVTNGDFNAGITGWSKINGDANALNLGTAAEAYEGNGSMKVINSTDNTGNQWKTQIQTKFTNKLTAATGYTISFYIRSDAAGSVRCSTTGNAQYQGDQTTSTAWKFVEWKITGTGAEDGFGFDLGAMKGTYYIDKVLVTPTVASGGGGGSSSITIEKTDAEKATIIGNAMKDWISKMVGHYKGDVFAWDVVNEPMKEDGTLRDGNDGSTATDYFSWVKYLGKDYAVTAFKLTRQNGNATDKLFINDYNLESRLDKCKGLIDYVKYIESQGATVDGIGTQMHISLDTDKSKIAEMFQLLAATGKLIKVSELDVRLGTNAPTVEQQAAQAAMYQYVIDMYKKYIPVPQQYGITIWGISDNKIEHENWLPNESPNLWDANYARKHAYKGTADGLAGKDVSQDFSGELQPKK